MEVLGKQKVDLNGILELYKQPDMDDGKVLCLEQVQVIFDRFEFYPNYKVSLSSNMKRQGAPSGDRDKID